MTPPNHSVTPPEAENPYLTTQISAGESFSKYDITTRSITDNSPANPGQGYLVMRDLIIPLSRRREVILGRDSGQCNVVLADPRVSKLHASIYFANGRFFVRDLGSVNGTFINRTRVRNESEALVAGDHILLRPYKMLFVGPDHPRVAKIVEPESEKDEKDTSSEEERRSGHFSGKLEILRITDLIQLLNSTGQSGVLTVRDADCHVAELTLGNGEIKQARYQQWRGEDAVYAILAHATRGEFEFVQGRPPEVTDPIGKPTLTLLLDGCRMLDEGSSVDPGSGDLGDLKVL